MRFSLRSGAKKQGFSKVKNYEKTLTFLMQFGLIPFSDCKLKV